MLSLTAGELQQIPLIHEVHADDQVLLNALDGEWFEILYGFRWEEYRAYAAGYYDALYEFNFTENQIDDLDCQPVTETKKQAQQRLLFDRATMQTGQSPQILYQGKVVECKAAQTDPMMLSPGVVPLRLMGRKPKCFFALLKSFIGTALIGHRTEPEEVARLLNTNPSFARVCGFVPKSKDAPYNYHHVPSLRKLEQFDQVMRQAGIWDKIKVTQIQTNLELGVIKVEMELVGDTTHYHAYSSFQTLVYEDDKGAANKKSQSSVTKRCRCEDWSRCAHEWILTDEGAGTVVKSKTKMYWAHKASVIGFPKQGIAIDAVAVMDAASHDGQTFFPHVQKVFQCYPQIADSVRRVLYDSACDDVDLKAKFKEALFVDLKASLNPRRCKPIMENLPRGIDRITPYGVPICSAGYEFDYKGVRNKDKKFIYQAPLHEDGSSVCASCTQRADCCNRCTQSGRTMTVSFDTLPQIDSNDPPMGKRFKSIMTRRPSVERMIKRLKCDLGDSRLSKRGNESFQAYLDKTMISYHLLIRHLH
jgi:hypothetical protein